MLQERCYGHAYLKHSCLRLGNYWQPCCPAPVPAMHYETSSRASTAKPAASSSRSRRAWGGAGVGGGAVSACRWGQYTFRVIEPLAVKLLHERTMGKVC